MSTTTELARLFPATTRLRTTQEVTQRAEEVLIALAGLIQSQRGKKVSAAKLHQAMREIVAHGLAWGQELQAKEA